MFGHTFVSSGGGDEIPYFTSGLNAQVAGGATEYGVFSFFGLNPIGYSYIVPKVGVAKLLRVRVFGSQPWDGALNILFTVNNVSAGLNISVPAGYSSSGINLENLVDTYPVSPGDLIKLQLDNWSASPSIGVSSMGLIIRY